MPNLPGLGSQTLPAQLHRAGLALRAEVQRHGLELSTGRAADPSRRLGGDLGAWSAIESRLARISAADQALNAQMLRAGAVQAGLAQISTQADRLRGATLAAGAGEATAAALARLGAQGRQTLEDIGSTLARGVAGQAPFAGNLPDRAPLAPSATILAAAAAAVAGATTADEVIQRVQDLFEAPGGVFETALYLGGAPVSAGGPPGEGDLAPLPTAADPALRATLQDAVLAALAGDEAALPDPALRRGLVPLVIARQAQTAGQLAALQGAVGATEAALADRRERLSVERDGLDLARAGRIGVDPYEAATRLEEARLRLESLYVVTARTARLTLTEYLR